MLLILVLILLFLKANKDLIDILKKINIDSTKIFNYIKKLRKVIEIV